MFVRGCDKQLTSAEPWIYPVFRTDSRFYHGLYKVRNFQCEQNSLERLAIDSESLVCKVLETLLLLGIYP